MISVEMFGMITDNIDLHCSMSWLFCLAFDLSSDTVVFGQLYYANTLAVPCELSACRLKESRTALKSKQLIYGSALRAPLIFSAMLPPNCLTNRNPGSTCIPS